MHITIDDLDGKYLVKSETSDGGPFIVNGDGETEIKNGLTFRKDKNGYIWESSFTIVNPAQIQMESTLDPTHAGDEAYIKDKNGNLTKSLVTYRSILDVSRDSGQLVLKGTIKHGGETTRVTMTKLG